MTLKMIRFWKRICWNRIDGRVKEYIYEGAYVFLKDKLEQNVFENILNLIFLVITLMGAVTSIFMNFVDRSLWLDEAALAYSFSTRTFWNLWNGSLENVQSAPLG